MQPQVLHSGIMLNGVQEAAPQFWLMTSLDCKSPELSERIGQ